MAEQQDLEEVEDDLDESDEAFGAAKARSPASKVHLAAVEAEYQALRAADAKQLQTALREVIAGTRDVSTEALVRLADHFHKARNRQLMSLAYQAALKTAAGLLISQAWDLETKDQKEEQAHQIFVKLFEDINRGKLGLAGRFFSAWALRRSIDEYRKRHTRFEGRNERIEPADEVDPLDEIQSRKLGPNDLAELQKRLKKIVNEEHRAVFIKFHMLQMTQEEIAKEYDTSVRTVHDWLKKAAAAAGQEGEDE